MLDFTKLWNKFYLFGPYAALLSRSDYIFFGAAVGFVILGIGFKIWSVRQDSGGPQQHFFNRFFHLFFTMGLLVLLWVGFRYEDIPWLGTHVTVLGLWLIWLIWLGFILAYWWTDFRGQQRLWHDELVKRKYLEKK